VKRFAWTLQRLLDVTRRREQAIVAQLADLAARTAGLRRQVAQRRMALRRQHEEIGRLDLATRMLRMETFGQMARHAEADIAALQEQARALHEQRQRLLEQFLQARARRQTLEKLREQALARWRKEAGRVEQKQSDELAGQAFARSAHWRAATAATREGDAS
jgi:flagellar export protein FliJ